MKKKMLSLGMAAALSFTAIIGGTLAYFTDTDQATNTFTAGGVSIDLIEKQVDDGVLVDFEQDQTLIPIVGSAQGEKDSLGQPIAENYIDKIVTIKNTSKSDAYVRAYYAIPSYLDDGLHESFNAGLNILHINFGNFEGTTTYQNQWDWKDGAGAWNYFETTIGSDGVLYNVYFADYYQVLGAGETTEQFLSGVYLDANVDMNDAGQYTITRNGVTTVIDGFDGSAKVPVFAVAVQADGFDSVDAAVDAAFGANFNPWAE